MEQGLIYRSLAKLLGIENQASQRTNYIWNTIAGFINAGKSIIILMLISYLLTKQWAGIFSYAIAFGNLMLTVGKFGMRNYQVTDTIGIIRFQYYLVSRLVTVFVMLFVCAAYNLYYGYIGQYSFGKCFVIMGMCILFAVDAFEDIFAGEFQRNKRLDVGAKCYCFRWGGIIIIFTFSIIFTKSLLVGCTLAVLFSVLCCAVFLSVSKALLTASSDKYMYKIKKVGMLLWECLPLCISGFLTYYICNASKYVIDKNLTDLEQAYYGYIAMPVFAIGLLSTIIYQPILVELANLWENNQKKFIGKILEQILLIFMITVAALLSAYFLGIPVLDLLYNVKLEPYKTDLLILISGGCMQAITGFMTVIFIIMRRQKALIGIYIINSVVAYGIAEFMVPLKGIRGASEGYWLTMLIITICLLAGALILMKIHNQVKE